MPSLSLSRRLILLLFGLALSACGFKLAGTASLPSDLNRIYLVTSNFNEQQRDALRDMLGRAGAEISAVPAAGAVRLSVTLQAPADRRLVTSASSGKTVERLVRQLAFSLDKPDGTVLAPAKTLIQQKDVVVDDDNLLSSTQEKSSVVDDLEKALFHQLIRQLKRI